MKFIIYIAFATAVLCAPRTKKVATKENKAIVSQTQKKIENERDSIISFSKKYLETPYLYAGNDPKKGFDCSGFVSYVFKNFDINLPRSSKEYRNLGVAVKPENFKIGDILVFYGYKDKTIVGHLGIICEANGMNSKFIHSSSGKAKGVTISELNSEHYTNRYYKCIDVISK